MVDFPLKTDEFRHEFGIQAIKPDQPLVQRTSEFERDMAFKQKLIDSDLENYFYANHEQAAVYLAAVVELLNCSDAFDSTTHRELLSELNRVQNSEWVPRDAIELFRSVAMAQQSDLVLLSAAIEDCFAVLGGLVAFPSGWSIRDKIGLSILQTHVEVPGYEEQLHRLTERLLQKLRTGRPVLRSNWGIRPTDLLDQSPKNRDLVSQAAAAVNCENAGENCFFRVERQTLSRLQLTNSNQPDAILFTIQTTQRPLAELTAHQSRRLLRVLATCPPEVLRYKAITDFFDPLQQYLRSRL